MEPLAWEQCEPFEITVHTVAARFAGRSGAERDDLIQEGWECVVAKLREGLTPSEEDVERWARSYIRQLERLNKGDTTGPFVTGGTPTRIVESRHIRDAIGSLPPELRTVTLMHGFGFTNIEIGLQLGIHRETVAVWLKDAKIRLRRALG